MTLLQKINQPHYITEVVRDGLIESELVKVRELMSRLTKEHQNLLVESRCSLAAASESTGVVIELWGSIEASLRALHTDLQCCEIIEPLDDAYLAQWNEEREKLNVLTLVRKFGQLTHSLPKLTHSATRDFVSKASLSELLLISSNFAVKETLNNPNYTKILKQLDLTKGRIQEILELAQAIKTRVLQDVKHCLNLPSQTQSLTHCLLIMENLSIINSSQLRGWLMEDCLARIKECRILEDCVAVLVPFCETVLRASSVARASSALVGSEIDSLKSIRREVWKELAIQLSQSVKTVLEQQGAVHVQSFADFQNGLDRISMAKDLESTVNMMAGPSGSAAAAPSGDSASINPRIKLKLRGTIGKLNSYITSRMTKQYRVFIPNAVNWSSGNLDQIEKSLLAIENWEPLRNTIPKADAVEAIDILNKLLIMVEAIPHELNDVSDTIVRWLALAHLINTNSSTEEYNSNYLVNNVIKMSKHPTEIAERLNLVDCF